ncbi:MAG: tetratricopeptide repeat protein, partial [Candidatus Rokuibacteriota bacterium]
TYERLRRSYPHAEWTAESLLPHARVLQSLGRRPQAQVLLEEVVNGAEGEVFGEAAARLGQILRADGQHASAVKWYLTAAYVAGDSTWGRRALLGALRCLIATGDRPAAEAIYRRLQGSTATEPALLAEAREALQVMSEQSSRGR